MVAHGVALGGISMRLKSSRVRGSSAVAVVAGCLGVYVVLATGFHWLVEPTLGKNQGVTAYEPSPARILPDVRQTVVAPVRSEPASRIASKPNSSSTNAKATSLPTLSTSATSSHAPWPGSTPICDSDRRYTGPEPTAEEASSRLLQKREARKWLARQSGIFV